MTTFTPCKRTLDRDEFGLRMLAAWLNVRVDQIPPENTTHLNPHQMEAWARVGRAALEMAVAECQAIVREWIDHSDEGEAELLQDVHDALGCALELGEQHD